MNEDRKQVYRTAAPAAEGYDVPVRILISIWVVGFAHGLDRPKAHAIKHTATYHKSTDRIRLPQP
jgi:hypothetical protein